MYICARQYFLSAENAVIHILWITYLLSELIKVSFNILHMLWESYCPVCWAEIPRQDTRSCFPWEGRERQKYLFLELGLGSEKRAQLSNPGIRFGRGFLSTEARENWGEWKWCFETMVSVLECSPSLRCGFHERCKAEPQSCATGPFACIRYWRQTCQKTPHVIYLGEKNGVNVSVALSPSLFYLDKA